MIIKNSNSKSGGVRPVQMNLLMNHILNRPHFPKKLLGKAQVIFHCQNGLIKILNIFKKFPEKADNEQR